MKNTNKNQNISLEDFNNHKNNIKKLFSLHAIIGKKTHKEQNIYLFIGRNNGEFTGNVKYLFLHFIKKHPEISSFFFTTKKDVFKKLSESKLPVLFYPSKDAIQIASQAGTVVVDSISFRRQIYYLLINNSRQIQLWHGVGNKKIGFQLYGLPCLTGRDKTLIEDHSGYDVIVSTSQFYTDEVFRKSMDAKQFVSLGYPRTDVFFEPLTKEMMIGCDTSSYAKIKKAKKNGPVILFTPTFRDTNINPITQNILNFNKLKILLQKINAHLIIKSHTRTFFTIKNFGENITILNPSSDIYPFMKLSDILITDYSSIYTEFLLLDRPIIFFWSDFDSYMKTDRGFQFSFEDMCPGPKCYSELELFQSIQNAIQGNDDWTSQREQMKLRAFKHLQGGSSERIANLLLHDQSE